MENKYIDLINRRHRFPQAGFQLKEGYLFFNDISLKDLIDKYGTPLKLICVPKIGGQISKAKKLFQDAIQRHEYKGQYQYTYCTKCCHYAPVVKAALRAGSQIETSSSFDIDIILKLVDQGEIDKDITLIHNGYKTDEYLQKVVELNNLGFRNSILVLDTKSELDRLKKRITEKNTPIKIGIRMAIEEKKISSPSNAAKRTSRLGIRPEEILGFYESEIRGQQFAQLHMLHFFVDSGIEDDFYYWGEFKKAMNIYVQLKSICPEISALDLGGGFPIQNNLDFDYNYENIVDKIVGSIATQCRDSNIEEPDIYTEFGKYTVGESGATIFSVLEQKPQDNNTDWYIVDNSLMTTIPDVWWLYEKFILLPINKWENTYGPVNLGGISCDHTDCYNSENEHKELLLPKYESNDQEPLYLGFFHTGAYQDSISSYGGVKHCLIPSPKIIVVDQDDNGNIVDYMFKSEQKVEEMWPILGYE